MPGETRGTASRRTSAAEAATAKIEGALSDRVVEPLGMVFSADHWYLVAYCRIRRDLRVFRADRIRGIELLDETFVPPPGFSLGTYLREEESDGGELVVELKASPALAARLRASTNGTRAVVYTMGYGGRSAPSLVRLLKEHGVDVVCDVRFSPRSRFTPWANYYVVKGSGPIKRLIEEAGLEYRWVGDLLGNPQPKDPSLAHFKALMRREAGRRTAALRALARRRRVCLLCASKDPARCHRRIIAEYLERKRFRCVHL